MTAQRPVGLGIIGCGGAAAEVARAARDSGIIRIVAVHDIDRGRATDLAAAYGARVHGQRSGLLADAGVDVAYIALPHDLLAGAAIAALRAHRHVLVEKPVATTISGVRAVRAVAAATGRSVGVMFELRQVPAVRRARELVRRGAIGRIRLIRIRTLIDKPPPYWSSGPTGRVADPWRGSLARAGGGVILMNTIHQLDLVRMITGLDVVRVAAEIEAGIAGVEVEDAAVATVRYANGAVAGIVAAAQAPGAAEGETIEIDGDAGAIRIRDPYAPVSGLELFLRRAWEEHPSGEWVSQAEPRGDPSREALDAFGRAIAGGTPPEPGLDDAEAAVATALAIYRSARLGRFVRVRRSFDLPATPPTAR
jgi:UDP-N-acetyl-2-amino-2-deoxyglucuronate dehydrogenase